MRRLGEGQGLCHFGQSGGSAKSAEQCSELEECVLRILECKITGSSYDVTWHLHCTARGYHDFNNF